MGISTRGSPKTSDNVLYVYTIPINIASALTDPGNFVDVTGWRTASRGNERAPAGSGASQLPSTLPLVRVITMPADANPNGDIFGGWLLAQMDLAGGSLATQRAQGRCATVAVDGMVLQEPVFVGDEVSCYAMLVRTERTSMTVRVEAWRRHLPSDHVRQVTQAIFTYVAIGEDRRPRRLPPVPQPARSTTDPCS